jgi:hypothetical protein
MAIRKSLIVVAMIAALFTGSTGLANAAGSMPAGQEWIGRTPVGHDDRAGSPPAGHVGTGSVPPAHEDNNVPAGHDWVGSAPAGHPGTGSTPTGHHEGG